MEKNSNLFINDYKTKMIDFLPKIGGSFIIFIIFYIIAIISKKHIISKIENNYVEKNKNIKNKLLYEFLSKIIYYLIIVIGIFFALSNLGINLNTLFIIFGSAGIAVALSIQSSFSQIVSGIIIIVFSYFKIGDLIQINNTMAFVEDFNLINTTVYDIRGVKTIIPNNTITNSNFTNYCYKDKIYLHFNVTLSNNNSINYDKLLVDIKDALIRECQYVDDINNVFILISSTSSYGTELLIRFLIKNSDYYPALYRSQFIVRKLLNDDNILLLDNSYLSSSFKYS